MSQNEELFEERKLTTAEVGKKLGFSARGVRDMCERGKFQGAYQIGAGGEWRIPESAVRRWLDVARGVKRRRARRGA